METWVQIRSRTLKWHGTQSGKAQTSVFCGFDSHPCHWIMCIAQTISIRMINMIANEKCVGWALASPSGCNPPASCSAGSTPARRTRLSARSSSGSGCWPLKPATRVQIPHGSFFHMHRRLSICQRINSGSERQLEQTARGGPSGATGRHATIRTSCPHGLGSSTLPLVTAGRTSQSGRDASKARSPTEREDNN